MGRIAWVNDSSTLLYLWLRTKRLAPLCYFLLLTTVIVWGLSGLSFFFDAFRIPLFAPVVLWLSVAALHLKADHFYRIHKVSDEKDVYVEPTDPGSILARANENDDRIILVAAAGGGIQAAAWTARVLTGLEEICAEKRPGRFVRSLKLLSGVSGGGVGIMYFVTACKLEGFLSRKRSGNGTSNTILQGVADVAKRSSLSEAIRGLAYTDFIRAVTPFFLTDVYRDRAESLERAWVNNAKELNSSYSEILKRATLRGWQRDVAQGELPAVIFNATIVETGERLAFSTTASSACLPKDGLTTCAAFQDFSSIYEGADIAITTAVRLSSAFPFISPPARPLPVASLSDGKPGSFYIMQSLPLFFVESQTAKRRLLKLFELPDDCGSQLERNGVVQGCEKRGLFQLKPWSRYQILSSGNRSRSFAVKHS